MVNLSGSYINDVDGPHGPTGGLNVTFAGPDGRLIGGPVEGLLIAGSPVQVLLKRPRVKTNYNFTRLCQYTVYCVCIGEIGYAFFISFYMC